MSWLKQAIIELNKPKQSIIAILKKNVGGMREGRDRSVVHASDITKDNFCPRFWALLDLKGVKSDESYISTALAVTFDMGNATERLVVEQWAGDATIGNWRCRRCQSQRTMCSKPLPGCGLHSDCQWEYQQIVVMASEYGVVGSIDALFDVGTPKLMITEVKTIKAEDFTDIVVPLPEHRIRTALYLKLVAESHSPYKDKMNLHEARVLYISRGYGKANKDFNNEVLPFKEYVVQRDDAIVKEPLQKAKALKIFRETKQMPNGICNTATDKYAKNCSACKQCFSGDHPAQIAWEMQ